MSKGLKALELIKNAPTIYVGCMSDVYTRNRWEVEVIEKELKLLEILKKYLFYIDSWYANPAQYDYEHIYLRMENSHFASDEEKEDLIKVKEWLKDET